MPARAFPRTTGNEVERELLLLIAMAQAAPSAPTGRIDLALTRPCATQDASNDDVIVCGPRRDASTRYRIPPPTPYESALPKAELQLGKNTTLSAETEQVDILGAKSNRAMIRLKIGF